MPACPTASNPLLQQQLPSLPTTRMLLTDHDPNAGSEELR